MLLMESCVFFNDTATTEIYTLALHDALPICRPCHLHYKKELALVPDLDSVVTILDKNNKVVASLCDGNPSNLRGAPREQLDRQSTRLNSSHANISYAVFCLNKKSRICYGTPT